MTAERCGWTAVWSIFKESFALYRAWGACREPVTNKGRKVRVGKGVKLAVW